MRTGGFLVAALLAVQAAAGATITYTGALATPEDLFQTTVILPSPGVLSFQTFGFGGDPNAAPAAIPGGGFDPFVGLFSGSGDSAVYVDGSSDDLTNYGSNQGCGPAATVPIGVETVCGDVAMSFSLAAGMYTVVLTDAANFLNAAVGAGTTLGDGFTDFSSGVFQTCTDLGDCISPTNHFTLDITIPSDAQVVPEPGSLWVFAAGLVVLAAAARRRSRF